MFSLTLAPELSRFGPKERGERIVEEVDDGLRLMCVEAAEPRRGRLVMRQVRDESISRPATNAAAGAPAGAGRGGRGGRRSERSGERWLRRGRRFWGRGGGGFGDVPLLRRRLPRSRVVVLAAVLGGSGLVSGRRGRHGWIEEGGDGDAFGLLGDGKEVKFFLFDLGVSQDSEKTGRFIETIFLRFS